MKIITTKFSDIFVIEPQIFNDHRGCFFENYHKTKYEQYNLKNIFVQDNISVSMKNVLRGLHFQYPNEQCKLVSVLRGEVFDVVVDIRTNSPTFGQWFSIILNEHNKKQLYIAEGFAHGFVALSDNTIFNYKCSDFYNSTAERSILWNDPSIGISWPITNPILSYKDNNAPELNDIAKEYLPK